MDGEQIKSKDIFALGVFVVAVIVVATLFFGAWTVIPAGHRGVVTNFGKVSDKIFDEGFHFKVPIYDSVHKMTVQTLTVTYDNGQRNGDDTEDSSLFAASKDLQDVQIAVVVNYHNDPSVVQKIYQQYQSEENYETNIVKPVIRETVKSISAQFTAEELVTKRVEFSDKVTRTLQERMLEKGAIFEKFNVVNFEFSKSFNEAIEQKVTAEQNALGAKNKLEQVKYEAEQRITQAKGEAEAIRIQAQAIQNQGGAEYVNLKRIEKWNGQGCTQYCGLETANGLLISR